MLIPTHKDRIQMRKIAVLIASLLVLAGCAPMSETSSVLETKDLWVKSSETSTIGGMTAVFGALTNNSNQDITLIGGTTSVANIVEVHEMSMIDGEMKMQQIDGGLVIPAGQTVMLEPGGNHLMLMDLAEAVSAGDQISVTFEFDANPDVVVEGITAKPSVGGDEDYHSNQNDMTDMETSN
jgi:copper(I)-binding protein